MTRRNIAANIAGKIWGIVSTYIFLPAYLRILGPDALGLVGFYSTIVAVLAITDLGMSATLSREVARNRFLGRSSAVAVRTYEALYGSLCIIATVVIWFAAPAIAAHWLKESMLPPGEVVAAIRLMGIGCALQLPSNLYVGGLMGLELQVASNTIQIAWGVMRGFGALAAIGYIGATIKIFFYAQIGATGAYLFALRWVLWSHINRGDSIESRFNIDVLRCSWKYAAGLTMMTVISTVLTQSDKMIVSSRVSLGIFGYYMIAVALAGVPRMLAAPIGSAAAPRLAGLVAQNAKSEVVTLYRRTCALIALFVVPVGLSVAAFPAQALRLWTGNEQVVQHGSVVASLLIAGEILQALTVPAYYVALAFGNVAINVVVGVLSVLVFVPTLVVLVGHCGVVGAGWSWFMVNILSFLPYMYYIHRRFIPGELWRFLGNSVLRPIAVCAPIAISLRFLGCWTDSRLGGALALGTSCVVCVVGMLIMVKPTREALIETIGA